MSNESKQLRDMAAQILSPNSKGKALFEFAADAIEERDEFRAAMEREKKADWEREHKDLANRLEEYSTTFTGPINSDLAKAARELRYMANSFTLKANFVPTKLMLEEARRLLSVVDGSKLNPEWRERRNNWQKGVMPHIYEMPNPLLTGEIAKAKELLSQDLIEGVFGKRTERALDILNSKGPINARQES